MNRKLALVLWLFALLAIACRSNSPSPSVDAGAQKFGGVYPQKAGDFWVNETAVSPFSIKDGSGNVRVSIDTSHGNTTFGGTGTDASTIVGTRISGATIPTIYLLNNGVSATTGNWAMQADGVHLYLGAIAGAGHVHLYQGGSTWFDNFNNGSSSFISLGNVNGTVANSVLQGDGTSYTDINAPCASCVIEFSTNNASTVAAMASGTQNGVALGPAIATVGHIRTPSGFQWLARNSANTGNNSVFYDDGADTIYLANSGYANAYINGSTQSALMGAGTVHVYAVAGGGVLGNSITHADANIVNGSIAFQTISISAARTIDTTTSDAIVYVDTSGGTVAVTLPTPTAGRWLTIVDKKNTFGTNACTLVRHAAEKIDNVAATKTLNANGYRANVISDGTDWYTM